MRIDEDRDERERENKKLLKEGLARKKAGVRLALVTHSLRK